MRTIAALLLAVASTSNAATIYDALGDAANGLTGLKTLVDAADPAVKTQLSLATAMQTVFAPQDPLTATGFPAFV